MSFLLDRQENPSKLFIMFKVALPIFFMSLLAGSQCFAQAGAPQ
ncbi:MAG: hypothetical protein QNL80_03790 [Akkermansiaceae bacterium]